MLMRCSRSARRHCLLFMWNMGALFRILVGLGVVLVIVSALWSGLHSSRRSHHAKRAAHLFHHKSRDNSSWRPSNRLLIANTDGQFHLNTVTKRLLSGELHYFRVHPAQWEDRLRRMRTAGLNTITTRIPWNLHEKRRGLFEFQGLFNIHEFIQLVHRLGFLLIVDVGPYIDADWELGGLPYWLLHDSNMVLRTSSYSPYINYVERYFNQLLPIIARYMYRRHGPIVAVQVEHELGSYITDTVYLQTLVNLVRQHDIQELILTADHWNQLSQGSVKGALMSVSCHDDVKQSLETLRSVQPGLPLFVTVYTAGAATRWNEQHIPTSPETFRLVVNTALQYNASINIYAFTGGTNFGLLNGAVDNTDPVGPSLLVSAGLPTKRKHRLNKRHVKQLSGPTPSITYRPTTTAYDYDTIVPESGCVQQSKKYHVFRRLLLEHEFITRLQTIPSNPSDSAFGVIKLDHYIAWKTLLTDVLPDKPVVLGRTEWMEKLNVNDDNGQGYGWIVYRTQIASSVRHINITGVVRDRALIYLNSRLVSTVYSDTVGQYSAVFNAPPAESRLYFTLEIVVENMGRASVGSLDEQRKGFVGHVISEGKTLDLEWEHYSIDFGDRLVNTLSKVTHHWLPTGKTHVTSPQQPTLYKGHFKVKQPKDTFIDMSKWTKGLVIVNGFVLGRYWAVGPQLSLYIPAGILLRGFNEFIIFELEKTTNCKVKFTVRPEHFHPHVVHNPPTKRLS